MSSFDIGNMASILFIQTAFLGDVILSTALAESWKQRFPGDSVDVLLRKGNESVFQNNPKIRNVLIWEKRKHKWKHWWHLLWTIRRHNYDQVFNLQRFASTGLLTILSGAKQTSGFDKNPFSMFFSHVIRHQIESQKGLHEIDRNHLLIKGETGLQPAKPRMYVPDLQTFVSLIPLKEPYITVSPASVWFTKQLPAEIWINFLSEIPQNIQIILLGGSDDKILCEFICRQVQHRKPSVDLQNLCGILSIPQSAALMQDALMNYVNDSAPLHMASAVNAPVCAVFCSTIPGFGFGPLSEQSFVIETREILNCKPCGLHGKMQCPEGHFRCATTIETEQLLKALKS